jgi:hypothetical protein
MYYIRKEEEDGRAIFATPKKTFQLVNGFTFFFFKPFKILFFNESDCVFFFVFFIPPGRIKKRKERQNYLKSAKHLEMAAHLLMSFQTNDS